MTERTQTAPYYIKTRNIEGYLENDTESSMIEDWF